MHNPLSTESGTDHGYLIEKDRVYVERGVSGKVHALQREQFAKLTERMDSGDSLVVTKLDRLGRDMLDVIATIRDLTDRGVSISILGLGTLDGSPQAKLTLALLAAISEYERDLISERTKAKLAKLKADGVRLGRPLKTTDEELRQKAESLFAQNMSWRKVAAELGIALSTLQRMMRVSA
ncbi:recombinase family protein [Aquitalea magnusonii]|uniref:Putative DNA-invertase from lambdoid prophage Rac n=1 Tax=Aquitalea magnusonii TaxID=332411 RepID=A0A318IQQ9_9NEIS|nr:recombinase family protein [Aquitalea magnusonii]PXX37839.1 putative DNA-invertase from lambdoid prophage Rac [Aquitalea magnusonii]